MTYLDVWRSGTFFLYSCKAAFWIQETSQRLSDVERSVVLRSVFAIGMHSLTCCFSGNVPSPKLVLQADKLIILVPFCKSGHMCDQHDKQNYIEHYQVTQHEYNLFHLLLSNLTLDLTTDHQLHVLN